MAPNVLHTHSVHMDGSYQAELYVAWEVVRARGAHRVVWGSRGQQWSFHDSKGCIDAVQSRNPGSSPLSDDLLHACQGLLAGGFDVPQHLYSHRVGTFLDSVLGDADDVAKRQAMKAQPRVGCVQGLQAPRVCFTHNTIQVHNLDRLVQNCGPPLVESPHRGPRAGNAQILVGVPRRHGTRPNPLGSPSPHDGTA